MKYGDLIQFDAIESVIQLLHANEPTAAQRMVASFVISPEMADRIADLLIPQIGFGDDVDHKGMMIIGNYGTGKSHLMSVLSAIAEDATYLPLVRNDYVRDAASAIAGRFKVHRIEVGGEMSLRAIITGELERFLGSHGIEFRFPPVDKVVNNKAALIDMMSAFEDRFPEQGILLVVDELLDYLRGRSDHQIVHDLSFMREVGEIASSTRFRFMTGVQEAVFDSGRFAHMADSLRRVKDRFQQVLIDRQDISFVVAERLLRKDAAQSAAIRKHLAPFAKFYESMADRLELFVRLFPVHPDYLAVFESISFAEKRSALATLSATIKALLPSPVPGSTPGLITYDGFWQEIRTNPVLRSDPSVREVVRVSGVLQERIEQGYPANKASTKAIALRLIAGLSVHRLTTGDVHVALGATPAQLRDQLTLYSNLGAALGSADPASDMLGIVEMTLAEIMRTVNGQFISRSPDSQQYYLDLKKDVDYDAQIAKRGESLDNTDLDKAYYGAILYLMERADEKAYVTGHRIWQYDLEWNEHRADRSGYLFFGAPNDRPTAQPDRDFYIYFVQPFAPPRFTDEFREDEVFFRLVDKDEDVVSILRTYWAARDLASISSSPARDVYASKAEHALKAMQRWLRDRQLTAFQVGYRGKVKPLQEWTKGVSVRERAHLRNDDTINFRDMVNVVAGMCLSPHFQARYPQYPIFDTIITQANRRAACTAAIKFLAGGGKSKDAIKILDALKLMDGDAIDPSSSPYAIALMEMANAKPAGQVLNRAEVFDGDAAVETFKPNAFGLEPELLAVVIAALVASGDLILALPGAKIDSTAIGKLAEHGVDDIVSFKHVERPKAVDVAMLRQIYELFGLPAGVAQLAAGGDDEAVRQLVDRSTDGSAKALQLGADLKSKLTFWGQAVLRDDEVDAARKSIDAVRTFAEDVSRYNTPGKLKNLRPTSDHIQSLKPEFTAYRRIAALASSVAGLAADAAYLAGAELGLSQEDPWATSARKERQAIADSISAEMDDGAATKLRARLKQLKSSYVDHYLQLHSKARMGMPENKTKQSLMEDDRRQTLRKLRAIAIMPGHELDDFDDCLGSLRTCQGLVASELSTTSLCPHCGYKPAQEALPLSLPKSVLANLDGRLDDILKSWTARLREEFDDPTTGEEGIEMAPAAQRERIRAFAKGEGLPTPLDQDFINGIKDALSGLVREELTTLELADALLAGGSPITAQDLRNRFQRLVENHLKGKDESKVRFVVIEKAS